MNIQPYTDGDEPFGFPEILASWKATWGRCYRSAAPIEFAAPLNVKQAGNRTALPPSLAYFERVRNPDLYFVESNSGLELGGIEITDHSPDGSNIEKRYPFLWASRRLGGNAFALSRYLKRRTSGQTNRLPFRHAKRNVDFLAEWRPEHRTDLGQLCQFLPLRELHLGDIQYVPNNIRNLLATFSDIGQFFAHMLAFKVLGGNCHTTARTWLIDFKARLAALAQACIDGTSHEREASTLLKQENRWIQVYNARPDSGHWERGEGQFDSIDGRLMFTLDEISMMPKDRQPKQFQFWLPQITSRHPWIVEQMDRDFQSKRLRNILVELQTLCPTRFADDLTAGDWELLQQNEGLLLERLDWSPGMYRVTSEVPRRLRQAVAEVGLTNRTSALRDRLLQLLSDEQLYFSTHRAYHANWRVKLCAELCGLPAGATVLVPRIPRQLIALPRRVSCRVLSAEECTREHLMLLRQIHRSKHE